MHLTTHKFILQDKAQLASAAGLVAAAVQGLLLVLLEA